MTRETRVGGMPEPVHAPPAVADEDDEEAAPAPGRASRGSAGGTTAATTCTGAGSGPSTSGTIALIQ